MGDAEGFDLVMLMYNLLKYSLNCSDTTSSLWFQAELLGKAVAHGNNGLLNNKTFAVKLKYLTNFWRTIEMLLINCKIEFKIKWTKHCVLDVDGSGNTNCNCDTVICNIIFYLLFIILSLSAKDNQRLSKFLSKGFERSVYWN